MDDGIDYTSYYKALLLAALANGPAGVHVSVFAPHSAAKDSSAGASYADAAGPSCTGTSCTGAVSVQIGSPSGPPASDRPPSGRRRLVNGGELFVSAASGVDGPSCGASGSPCASLRHALLQAATVTSFDRVRVAMDAGEYGVSSCGVLANFSLSLVGSGSSATVVDCGLADRFLITSGNLSMSGLTVRRAYLDVVGSTFAPLVKVGLLLLCHASA